jgi:hypothetical protein
MTLPANAAKALHTVFFWVIIGGLGVAVLLPMLIGSNRRRNGAPVSLPILGKEIR